MVREDEDGFLSVDYVEIIPVLIEAFNQHLEVYHREQKELKSEFDTWRRLLGDKDTPSTEKKSAESSSTMLKELIMVKKQPGGKTAGLTRRARNDSSGSEADLEAARSPIDDEEPDSLDRSSGSTTDGEEDVEEDFRHSCAPLTADQVEAAGVAGGAEERASDLLAVDLDRLVANKGHLASLAAQMNKLIPDRQYTDLLKYVYSSGLCVRVAVAHSSLFLCLQVCSRPEEERQEAKQAAVLPLHLRLPRALCHQHRRVDRRSLWRHLHRGEPRVGGRFPLSRSSGKRSSQCFLEWRCTEKTRQRREAVLFIIFLIYFCS